MLCYAALLSSNTIIRARLSWMQTTRENERAVSKEVVKSLLVAEVTITLIQSKLSFSFILFLGKTKSRDH